MMKFDHVGIKAKDLEKSIKFYTEGLGLEVLERLRLVGHDFVFVGNAESRIEIEQAGKDDIIQDVTKTAGQAHFAFFVDNIEEKVERAKAHGAKVIVPPVQLRPDRRTSFIQDPDGARIQLIEMLT